MRVSSPDPPRQIGPYAIERPLGEGGMGIVYLARHRATRRPAALKTIKVPHPGLVRGLRREIHALAALRHPGIVRVFDHGLAGDVPWYAMELVAGRSLRDWLQGMAASDADQRTMTVHAGAFPTAAVTLDSDAPPGSGPRTLPAEARTSRGHRRPPHPLEEILTIVRRLCPTLAYLHGEGIVHRDLKPDNVILTPGLKPVIVDFGLSAAFRGAISREAPDLETDVSGTLAYIAPEQWRGDLVDARADLYALGCMLYELLTGRTPGASAEEMVTFTTDRGSTPPPPSTLIDGVPPALDELVLRLLEREPSDRIGYAADVDRALAELGAENGAGQSIEPRPYLYRPRLSGRADMLERIARELEMLEAGSGALVILSGESGVGKTRLAVELGRRLVAGGREAVTAVCATQLAGADGFRATAPPLEAFHALFESVADRCRLGGLEETRRVLGVHGKVLAPYFPAFEALPGQSDLTAPGALPGNEGRRRVFEALAHVLGTFSRRSGVVVLLDDLQWADELTLYFLEHVISEDVLADLPVFILATCRAEDVERSFVDRFDSARTIRAELPRLERSAVEQMVGDMLALRVSSRELTDYIVAHTEGNPLFVAEYLLGATEAGALRRDDRGQWHLAITPSGERSSSLEAVVMPRSLRELIGERLDRLSAGARDLARAGAVLGRTPELELLERMIDTNADQLLRDTNELVTRRILEPTDDHGSLRFQHDKLREIAHADLEPDRRTALHRRAAELISGLDASRHESRQAELAHHWEQAGERALARPCYLRAARQAYAAYAYGQAETLYGAHRRLVDEPTDESILARRDLSYHVLARTGRLDEALAESEAGLREAEQHGLATAEAELVANTGILHFMAGRKSRAIAYFERGEMLFGEIGDDVGRARMLGNLAVCLHEQGNLREALARTREILELFRREDDQLMTANALTNLANLHRDLGEYEPPAPLYDEALGLFRELGLAHGEAMVLGNIGILRGAQGRLDEARAAYTDAIRIYRDKLPNARAFGIALCTRAGMELANGAIERARVGLDEALAINRGNGTRIFVALTLATMARLERLVDGRFDRASALLEEAEVISATTDDVLLTVTVAVQRGHLAIAAGASACSVLEPLREAAAEMQYLGARRLIEHLDQANACVQAGEHDRLFRGECIETLLPGLRSWLIRAGLLADDEAPRS